MARRKRKPSDGAEAMRSILSEVPRGRMVKAEDLADKLGVHVRSVYRYAEDLRRFGVNVGAFNGYGGGYCLRETRSAS